MPRKAKVKNTKSKKKRKRNPGVFFRSKIWEDRQFELLLIRDGSPSYFVGDISSLKKNWSEIKKFDSAYFGLNPSNVDPAHRNCITRKAIGRNAKSITSIRFLYVDVDPVRPAGTCATRNEKRNAKTVAEKIEKHLAKKGSPDPWVFDSGNGYHVLYPCNLETTDVELHKRLLTLLGERFDTAKVKVDRTVSDLARVCRLPATTNRKGDNTKDRPHRKSEIISVPTNSGAKRLVTRDMLKELLGNEPEDRPDKDAHKDLASEAMRPDLIARVGNYVSKMSPSVSGQSGHNRAYAAARKTVEMGCNFREAKYVLEQSFNPRCEPPWTKRELEHKLKDAFEKCGSETSPDEPKSQVVVNERDGKSTNFFGYVPDFALIDMDFLPGFPMFGRKPLQQPTLEWFALMQFKKPKVILPQEFVRQLYFPAPIQQNWRPRLEEKIPKHWTPLDNYKTRKNFDSCAFCHNGISPHTHFEIQIGATKSLQKFLAILDNDGKEIFADQRAPVYEGLDKAILSFVRRKGSFFSFRGERKKLFTEYCKQGKFRLVYLPTLLLGSVAGLHRHEIRALLGITNELSGTKEEPLTISKASVPDIRSSKKSRKMFCPLLDPTQDYVVFGGNRRNGFGTGYKLFGRTDQGLVRRMGFWDSYKIVGYRQKPFRMSVARFIFESLVPMLPGELQLTVAAFHPGRNEWKGLYELQQACRSEAGFNWINQSTIRFFAPTDWCYQWRSYLSKQLGYNWIPATSSECTQASNPNFVTSSELLMLAKSQGWNRGELAHHLSRIAGHEISKKKIQRHLSGESKTPEFWRLATELVRSH